jgi:hypothetical protein
MNTTTDENASLADIPRNDVAACERYYRAKGSRITGAEWRVMWHLQDNPARFERASKSWRVVTSN